MTDNTEKTEQLEQAEQHQEVNNKLDIEENNFNIKIPKKMPYYLLSLVLVIIFSVISYSLGAKTAYNKGFNNGTKQSAVESQNEDYANGFTKCYLRTLGALDNVDVGWYILKVDTGKDDDKLDDVTKSFMWQLVFKGQKPLSITNGGKISEGSMYSIKDDQVWYVDK